MVYKRYTRKNIIDIIIDICSLVVVTVASTQKKHRETNWSAVLWYNTHRVQTRV